MFIILYGVKANGYLAWRIAESGELKLRKNAAVGQSHQDFDLCLFHVNYRLEKSRKVSPTFEEFHHGTLEILLGTAPSLNNIKNF